MALIIKHQNRFGQTIDLYWRYNGLTTSSNRQPDGTMSVPSVALFRAFASEEAFKSGFAFLEERYVTFFPSSANADTATEAYAAFSRAEIPPELAAQIERLAEAVAHAQANAEAAEAALAKALEDAVEAGDPATIKDLDRRIVAQFAADRVRDLTLASENAAEELAAIEGARAAANVEKAKYEAWAVAVADAVQA